MSPAIHNACLQRDELDMVYIPFRVPAEGLEAFIEQCARFDVTGLSVTIPHKERILRHVNDIDNDVSAVKACNTILFRGPLRHGKNTDIAAAMRVLKQGLGKSPQDKGTLQGKKALVLGGGGVAKAIAWGLQQEGARVFVSARSRQQAELIAADLKMETLEWEQRVQFEGDVLINGTPVGMFPNMNETPFPAEAFREGMVVFDTIYNPQNTLFIKQAQAAGCQVVYGSDMFVEQAALQYQYFTGKKADKPFMAETLRRAINPARYS
jgi:3-dehydroquinate dehydratase/shikimate dehydrogenase